MGVIPFFVFTLAFLLVPTAIVVFGAFLDADNAFTTGNVEALTSPSAMRGIRQSVILSAITAVIGASIGAVFAYALSTSPPGSVTRRFVTSLCGVIAQFGGVALAFAFIASFGATGMLTLWLDAIGLAPESTLWLYQWNKGLVLVYLYFQIPLMLIVFMPAVEGLRPQWREATETLGGTTWTYWRRVAGPILFPSFVGAMLLLFTNAFSAYATAYALATQGSPLVPLQIAATFRSEVVLGQANIGKALALSMVVVVAVVMMIYAWLDKRSSRWMQR